jgi:heme a synthase
VHVESTLVARARRFELSPTTFRRLALGSALWLWLIVVTGATVRLTASGLGCEHWPGCTAGNPFPSKSYHSFIEFGNRIVSALTILATLLAWAGARFTPGVPRWVRWLALATFLGTLAQAPLGAITVYAGLNPWLVMSHFLLALCVLAAGVIVAVEAISFERGRTDERLPRIIRVGSLVSAAALFAMVLTGAISTAAGPHPGGSDVERLWHLHAALYVHVRATAIFGAIFIGFLVYVVRNRHRWPLYVEAAVGFLGLLLLQMGVGELQYRTHLPWWLVLIHVALAGAVWASMVAIVAIIQRPPKAFAPRAA